MENILLLIETAIGGTASRLWPLYIPCTIGLAYLVYRRKPRDSGFFAWLFPKSMYLHRSHLVDLQLFLVGRIASIAGLFNLVAVSGLVAISVSSLLGQSINTGLFAPPWLISLAALVVTDFTVYWVHRIHHEHPTLWPFHAVHHSAEVMTPVTVYRKHPIYDLISGFFKGVLIGLMQGLLLVFMDHDLSFMTIMGINGFYFVFNMLTANLRHSHVWLSFGPVMERVFISPAQHQIHHSSAVEHHNKNYGEVLAIWDWMFGTLYLPQREEILTFGLSDAEGRKIDQPHPTLARALVEPVQSAWTSLRGNRDAKDDKPSVPAE